MDLIGWRMVLLLVALLATVRCDAIDGGYTKIGEVVKNPSVFDGKEVKIRGKVVDVLKLPLVEIKFYSIKDETGEILVLTSAVLPGMGAEVRVKGSIESMVIIGDKSLGLHMKELQRW